MLKLWSNPKTALSRYRWATLEQREHQRRKKLGQRHTERTKQHLRAIAHSPEVAVKILAARLRQRLPLKMTSIEIILRREFKKRRLKFEMHKSMFGRFQPDFVFEEVRLIVQADGDYWHRQSTTNAERDQRFNSLAYEEGWTVWRFAESEIIQHPKACGRAVARFVRSH